MKQMLHRLAVIGVFMLASGAQAQFSIANPDRGASVYAWSQDLSGEIGGSFGGGAGRGSIQEDGETSLGVTLNLGKWEFGYTKLDNTTRGTVRSTFNFDSLLFTTGDTFKFDHEITMFDLFRRWTFVNNDHTNVYGLFGFKVLDFQSRVTGLTGGSTGQSAGLDESIPLPMIGFAGRFGPKDGLQGFAGLRWFGLEVGDVDADVLDASVGLAYRFQGTFHSAIGWRMYKLDVKVDVGKVTSGNLNLENEGLFFELGLQF